ncbi:glycine/D-amino acid oxidase-like deaminating enzyme [Microbacterium terrae]|uniref:Gamma-glutamylputrescine oxidoreductase n=1 Tax=Microbacterium terrae TaxID=69369 RepID=A0A0M2GVS2_9MICO|nr:FAD-dependent oxidoreductase [Microbacterium terrae]KJL37632.1 Gamma-glutamylputrescine oxidoreductase [Microbacterium terrae]MBP1076464.1 glycine/D-amino acid oxidase-like deaminating enzyme [Microbacterium terrae]GLJ97293.1 FAD-dependent oxidoreductase [Microbacterium terrae]
MDPTAVPNGDISWWWRDLGGAPTPRASLTGDLETDVAIVGGGYTGLWTAYYLKTLQPDLRVTVLEQRFAGFGASGRNGGWLTNSVTGGRARYGRERGAAQQRALNESVDEVIAVAAREGIDADIVKGGEFEVARTPSQLTRLRAHAASEQTQPHTDLQLLDAADAASRIGVSGTLGGTWHPHCARIHPARLARGLAETVERLGVRIHEQTRVSRIEPGRAITDHGTVRATHVIRATEGFTPDLAGEHRTWLPMNSSMIVTDPLPASFWDAVGWSGRETLGDYAHVYMYAQRTADDRIAFGGRGVPYRFGSRVDSDGRTQERTIASLTRLLREFFPDAAGVPIAHAWAGVLGVPRDWAATVGHDRATGLGWAGGYVGTGVTATNLAGRTLADLVLGRDTDLVRLPWVGHRAKRWEVEPLRWTAVNAIYTAYHWADRIEASGSSDRTAWPASVVDVVAGRH